VATILHCEGLGEMNSTLRTWYKTQVWNGMESRCCHLTEVSFWWRLTWKQLECQEHLQPGRCPLGLRRSPCHSKDQTGNRSPVLQGEGLHQPSRGLRKPGKVVVANQGNFKLPNSTKLLPYLGAPLWQEDTEIRKSGSREKEVFGKIWLEV
jgi:hypothetical protein